MDPVGTMARQPDAFFDCDVTLAFVLWFACSSMHGIMICLVLFVFKMQHFIVSTGL